jgi:DNA-binding NtrC family response regulator
VPAGETTSITVLVCDDEQGVGRLTARLLERAGIGTIVAGSGAEALAVMDREPVDAVVTDQATRGMSGVALHAAASERHPRLRSRFILVSGDPGDPELAAFARRTGVPVLGKPFAAAELVDLVRTVMGG